MRFYIDYFKDTSELYVSLWHCTFIDIIYNQSLLNWNYVTKIKLQTSVSYVEQDILEYTTKEGRRYD